MPCNNSIIKIYGERNSGTNYLEEILRKNSDSEIIKLDVSKYLRYPLQRSELFFDLLNYIKMPNNLGWKHGIPPLNSIARYKYVKRLKIITITKNPYSFLLSFFKRPYHQKKIADTFQEFLSQDLTIYPRDRLNIFKRYSPVNLWNYKNQAYMALGMEQPVPTINLTYENLVKNPEKTFFKIVDSLDLSHTTCDRFNNHITSTKSKNKTYADYKRYYLNESWRCFLTPEILKLINEGLDKRIVDYFSYDIIDEAVKSPR